MKVSMVLVCLALVPFVALAAPAPEAAPEEEMWSFDWTFGGLFETDPVVTLKEKTQQALDKMNEAHVQVNDLIEEWSLPQIPGEEDYLTVQEIQDKIDELTAKLTERIQLEIDGLQSVFVDEPEGETEPETNPEPEPEQPVSLAEKFMSWFN